jgi:hypothetical protein
VATHRRYIAAILWASDGEIYGGETWRLQCAYLQEEGDQELNRQQHPWVDRPWRAVDHLRVGDASMPCGRWPQQASVLWQSSIVLDAPRHTPYAPRHSIQFAKLDHYEFDSYYAKLLLDSVFLVSDFFSLVRTGLPATPEATRDLLPHNHEP